MKFILLPIKCIDIRDGVKYKYPNTNIESFVVGSMINHSPFWGGSGSLAFVILRFICFHSYIVNF